MTTSTYHRPSSSLTLHHDTWSAAVNESEQVHLQLGGPGEMTVVFASATASTPSEVSWECLNCAVPTSGNVTGKAHAYSTLMYFTKYLTAPALGAPYATDAQIVALQNTSSWAFDPFYASEQGDSYSDSAKPQFGLGAYSNPQEVYTSPVLHTVRLQNLTGGTTYAYRVAGSERLFNFSMPVNGFNFSSPYPFVLALTADLGQTAASKANVLNLLQIATSEGPGRGVALLSGDLSYADGYGPRWDSYARMMEPLASAVPVMVTGGNHEFGDGEAWTACARRAALESFLSPQPRALGPRKRMSAVLACCALPAHPPSSCPGRAARAQTMRAIQCPRRAAARCPTCGGVATLGLCTSSRCARTPPRLLARCSMSGSRPTLLRLTASRRRGCSS